MNDEGTAPHSDDASQNGSAGSASARGSSFQTTRWTLIHAAQDDDDEAGRVSALESLCTTYWYPLYAYVRRRGYSAQDAEDLTQGFFLRLLDKDWLQAADREKGTFRTFLLVAMKRFLANEWHRDHAQKRGGFAFTVPIDQGWAEDQYQYEPKDHVTPDMLYERRWAITLLQQAVERVRNEMDRAGRLPLFHALKGTLTGDPDTRTYAELAADFGMTESGVKAAAHRMRGRFRHHVRGLVADTVNTPEQIEEELQHLFSVFSR